MKLCWLDIRLAGDLKEAVVAEAVHQRLDAVVSDDPAELTDLPPTMSRVLVLPGTAVPADIDGIDVLIVESTGAAEVDALAARHPTVEVGRLVDVVDAQTLDDACRSARLAAWTVLRFRDSTRIPLEIVLAAAAESKGRIICVVADPAEAEVVFGVLEHGPDGVMLAPTAAGDATLLKQAAQPRSADLPLVELKVVAVTHAGMGERACVDTCTYLRPDEGILVGSHSKGMVLCVSETHPLPYMPTRPFRVNAGALMSYTVATGERTQYLSELCAGSQVLAVDTAGHTRPVTVGRVKIETRPLLSIDAIGPHGQPVNLIVQDDWHVRVLGPGGAVLNSTALKPGDSVLGYLPTKDRHVGYPINELCYEQ